MARSKAQVSAAQKLTGYSILAVLALVVIGLIIQQSRFNPAVVVAMKAPALSAGSTKAAGGASSATAALLPEVAGFGPLAAVESYGPDNLSDKIDGKAELYLSAGFKEMSCRTFGLEEPAGTHLDVYLYDMGTPANAYAVFSGQRRHGSPNIPLTANAYATSNAIFFTRGQFYVELVADKASETLKDSLQNYAKAMLTNLPAAAEGPDKAALFPKEGLAADSIRLSATDTFGLEGFNDVLTGEYTLPQGKATAFIAARPTPEQAKEDAKRYLNFLTANGYKKVPAPGAPADVPVLALEDSFEVVLVKGRTLAGVHDASSLAAAVALAGDLEKTLKDKP